MKKRILHTVACALLISSNSFTSAQSWVRMMQDPSVNFYQTVDSFNAYWATHTVAKGKGYKVFRRWQAYMEPRVFPTGNVKLATLGYKNYETFQIENPDLFIASHAPNNWTPLGPNGAPTNGGAGRLNFVRQDPSNAAVIYVGAPDGGIWKTINGGTSWATTTDQVTTTSIGFGDLAFDPTNSQILYASTGDAHAQDSYSVGLLKSINGGSTWTPTGLTFTVNQGAIIKRVLVNPTNNQIIIVASNAGILRSTDGGTNWTTVRTGLFGDMEFKPGDPTVVYAAGSPTGASEQIWKSTNSGSTWTQVTSGLPTSNVQRISLAVSANNPAYLYVLAGNSTNQGLLGVYRSIDSGTTFTTRTGATPNYLGYQPDGSDAGGQAFYDLTIACSPTNAQEIYIGGINIWRSINGGTNWTFNADWTGGSAPYVHSDVHDIMFATGSGTALFAATDGGLFKTTNNGTAWSDISGNLAIAQQYSISSSQTNANKILTGHQDNGANLYSSGSWVQVRGGDGMDVVIDRTNASVMYEGYVNGEFYRSTNGGAGWTAIFTTPAGTGGFFAPFKQDPTTATTVYGGYEQLHKSTNQGTTTTVISAFAGTTQISEFAIAPSNSQIIYVIRGSVLWKTINGGTSWTNVTGTIPATTSQMTYIAISPTDPNKVWVTVSGYTAANKVFKTINGGTAWTNISTGLPNLPVNCIVFQPGSTTDAIYVGCDVGVFYKDNSITGWQTFFNGLPNVAVRELDIYAATGKMRAATYGRSSWTSDVNTGANAPSAQFSANITTGCVGSPIQFTDESGFAPTSWAWTFPSGSPATSTAQNPSATWATPGTYTVQLIATNANGSNTITQVITIATNTAIAVLPASPFLEGFVSATFPPTNWSVTDLGAVGTWARTTNGIAPTAGNSAFFNNYNIDNTGARDVLTLPKLNVSGSSAVTMTFDVAYARYDATSVDTLIVQVSSNCGATWTDVYSKNGTTLATNGGADQSATGFSPTAAQWRNETINLNAYNTSNNLLVRFVNGAKYGQALYIDNVNLSVTAGATAPVVTFPPTTPICAGATYTPTNTYSNTPTSYAWTSSPAGVSFSSTTVANPIITFPGGANTYTLNVVATNGLGASPMASQTITVNPIPATPAATVSTPLCAGATIALTTPATAGATFAWSGPNGYTGTTQNPTITGATAAMAGVYTVTKTVSGCTSLAGSTNSLIVNPIPATPIATVSTPVCAGTLINLTSTATAGATYAWVGPNGFTSTVQNPTITAATSAMAGVYSLTKTVGGCTSLAGSTVALVVNAIPATPVATVSTPVCTGATISLATPTVAGATYAWSGPSAYTATTQNPARTGATAAMAGAYSLIITVNGCQSLPGTSAALVVNPVPATPTAAVTSAVCAGSSIALSTPTSAGATYAWTGPNAYTSSVQNPTIVGATAAMAGIYSVTTIVAGCSSLPGSTATLTVNAPPVTPSPTNAGPYCSGSTINLNTTTVTGGTYAWSGPNGFTSSSQNPTIAAATSAMSGTYNLTITNGSGCVSAVGTTSVVVNSTSVSPTISTNSPICVGSPINLSTPTVAGALYAWSGPNGFTSSIQNPILTPSSNAMSGNYTLSVTAGGCTSAIGNTTVVVNALPVVSLGADVLQINPGASIDAGAGFSSYLWSTGATTQSIIASTNGIYICTVTNAAGCLAIDSIAVTYTLDLKTQEQFNVSLYPNPNDGIFNLAFESSKTVIIEIYDAQGKLVFSKKSSSKIVPVDISNEPNGTYNLKIKSVESFKEIKIVKNK
jgi:PKD repeat protein